KDNFYRIDISKIFRTQSVSFFILNNYLSCTFCYFKINNVRLNFCAKIFDSNFYGLYLISMFQLSVKSNYHPHRQSRLHKKEKKPKEAELKRFMKEIDSEIARDLFINSTVMLYAGGIISELLNFESIIFFSN
ncbi:hypothetical protein BpHYR1_036741, partial [Brachionus plicatilis]